MVSNSRSTKYSVAIIDALQGLGHATNLQLLEVLRKNYPDLSSTTIHRITTRLAERGTVRHAPKLSDGSMRYDANTANHDHFMCTECQRLKDVNVSEIVIPILKREIKDCDISGDLIISGICARCKGGTV
jgi:Fur family transcriptional regulator, peroxide stress response regulator